MKLQKILIISLITIVLIAAATFVTFSLKPEMHKTIMLENLIFIRSK